ncbi:hypothetical protein LCGC14_0383040 [marine sediment metagenome]|uniref:Uncharacterized protein n=1 Tax=marine sediment metagenome TaxID=412755 RepID=A0A0F9T1I0_9ZZZZ
MPFDANLVLADTTLDWTFNNLVTNDYGTPTSTNRNSGGFAVIDLLAVSGTSKNGLAVIFVADETALNTDDALTLKLQVSDAVAFGSGVETLALFEVNGATQGIIIGSETPVTVVRRFTVPFKRYIRVDASCVSGDNFKTCQVLLAPWPFWTL